MENEEAENLLWSNLDRASSRRDFDSVSYWMAQILIHRQRNRKPFPVIEW